jgi:hypothetical protein
VRVPQVFVYDSLAAPGGPGPWVGWWDKTHSGAGFPVDAATGAFVVPRWAYVPDDATAGVLLLVAVPAAFDPTGVVPEPSYDTPMAAPAVATLVITRATAAVEAATTSVTASASVAPEPAATVVGGTPPLGTPTAEGTMAQPSASPPALGTPDAGGSGVNPTTTPVGGVDGAGAGGAVLHTNGSGTDSSAAENGRAPCNLLVLLAPLLLCAAEVLAELRGRLLVEAA